MNMAKRRANHEGTLYRRKDGLWCAQVSLDGHRLSKYGKTQRECHAWIKETLAKIDTGLTCESIYITLESFINNWLNGKQLSRRERTVFQYRKIAENYILPHRGMHPHKGDNPSPWEFIVLFNHCCNGYIFQDRLAH
jgi:hypothetical protein